MFSIYAIIKDMRIFFQAMLFNKGIIGFILGIFVTVAVASFVLTKDVKAIPLILRYSQMDSFLKLVEKRKKREKEGTILLSFSKFLKVYTQIRLLFLITIISFFVMITTVVLTSRV